MSQEFPSDVVKAIQDSVRTEMIKINGREFATRQVFAVPEVPTENLPDSVELFTLSGLIQFVRSSQDQLAIEFIHIVDHEEVLVCGPVGTDKLKRRPLLARASLSEPIRDNRFKFGSFMPVQDFVIGLQTGFVDIGDRADLLKLVGNLQDEAVKTVTDDGVTQVVAARQGISLVADVKVPNPVRLAPYRTFPEVSQPISPFIFRVQRSDKGGLPTVGLFETSDGQWQLQAMRAIEIFIETEIKDIPVIA